MKSSDVDIDNILRKHIDLSLFKTKEQYGWTNELIEQAMENKKGCNPHTLSIRLGEVMERVVKDVARIIHHGRVPFYICGNGVSEEEALLYFASIHNGQFEKHNTISILTKIDVEGLTGILGSASGILKKFGQLNHKTLRQIYNKYSKYLVITDTIHVTSVDLAIYRGSKKLDLYEIKLSGDVDSKKSKSIVIESILIPFLCTDNPDNTNMYVGILSSNKDLSNGTKPWRGSLSKYIDSDMILIEKDFFSRILPKDYSFEKFIGKIKTRVLSLINPRRK